MRNPVRGAVDSLANSRGRSTQHILIGLGLTVGAVAVSALVARMNAPTDDNWEVYSDYEELVQPEIKPPSKVFSMIWPPLFTALTLSGLRIWNAPRSPARTQALTLWGTVQALNAVWMALGPSASAASSPRPSPRSAHRRPMSGAPVRSTRLRPTWSRPTSAGSASPTC